MQLIIAQIIGFVAVGLYLLSFQFKKRTHIVWVTFVSNAFYVLQYFLLGAFSGAIMDILSTAASFLAAKKHAPRFKKHTKLIAALSILIISIVGGCIAIIRHSLIELIPVFGAVFSSISLWCDNEQTLRKFGLCSTPFWLVYNFISKAYGPALGSLLAMISIIVSLFRYRKNKNTIQQEPAKPS